VKLAALPSDKVTIIEKTVGPPGLYHQGDVYVYPSRLDGLGLTVCEALSCGLPVITTDCQPMSEFIIPGYNGQLIEVAKTYPRKDGYYWPISEPCVESLAGRMYEAYKRRDLLSLWKQNARSYAQVERDWHANAKAIEIVLTEAHSHMLSSADMIKLKNYDRRDLLGKLDAVYNNFWCRRLIGKIIEIHRKKRQPHLYNNH
jgi:hypothetical protein